MADNKLYCDNCGAEVKASDSFCDNCGVSFVDDTKSIAKEKEEKVLKTVNGLRTVGLVLEVLTIIGSCIMVILAFVAFGNEYTSGTGVGLLIYAILSFVSAFIIKLVFDWLSYMLEDVHKIRLTVKK